MVKSVAKICETFAALRLSVIVSQEPCAVKFCPFKLCAPSYRPCQTHSVQFFCAALLSAAARRPQPDSVELLRRSSILAPEIATIDIPLPPPTDQPPPEVPLPNPIPLGQGLLISGALDLRTRTSDTGRRGGRLGQHG